MTRPHPASADPASATDEGRRQEELALRHLRSVAELFEQRADLVGVHPFADLLHDAARWCA